MEIDLMNSFKITEQFDIATIRNNSKAINSSLSVDKFALRDVVDSQNIYKDKTFVSNTTSNISEISKLSVAKKYLSEQSNILNDMKSTIKNSSSQEDLDANYNSLLKSSSSYNSISSAILEQDNINEIANDERSRIFFDGVPGAKPLSSKEISQAIEQQAALNKYINTEVDLKIKELVSNTIEEIKTQQHESIKNNILKSVDFEYESKNFATQRFLDISSQMVDSQSSLASTINITNIIS